VDSKLFVLKKLLHHRSICIWILNKSFSVYSMENSNIVPARYRKDFFLQQLLFRCLWKFYRLRFWLCQISNHKTNQNIRHSTPNVVCSSVKTVLLIKSMIFFWQLSETCIIDLILSIKRQRYYIKRFRLITFFITNCKIEKFINFFQSRSIFINCRVFKKNEDSRASYLLNRWDINESLLCIFNL
jgi:hypothetical protein